LPCYSDEAKDLPRLIDEELRAEGLTIAPDARAALVPLLGGDRLASRNEIRKLALYAYGKERIEVDDVLAVASDASTLAMDALVDAAFAGRPRDLEAEFAKTRAAATAPGTILSAALRHVGQMHKATLAVDQGAGTDEALRVFIPPVHFRRKTEVESALRAWTPQRLARVMGQLAEAVLETRRQPTLAESIAQRSLLSIATSARRRD
jgi:DNA polymerase-3 subunit delta